MTNRTGSTSTPVPRILLGVAVRGGALLGGQWLYQWLWSASTDEIGADIGAGLIGFGLVIVASLVWGALDGRRWEVGRLALTWLGAGLVSGLFIAGAVLVQDDGVGTGELVTTIALLTPFMTGLVAVPALVAGAVTSSFAKGPGGHPGAATVTRPEDARRV